MRKPLYYQKYYAKIYDNKELSEKIEKSFFIKFFNWSKKTRMHRSLIKEIGNKDSVLVIGVSFGKFIEKVAKKSKRLSVLDISRTQLSMLEEKLDFLYPYTNYLLQNADARIEGKYDVVICNNILHEVPIASKTKIVNNALRVTKNNGKTIFIDYHKPNKTFLFTYFVRMFNRLYQPFAEKMWDRSIETYSDEKHLYEWKKIKFANGCFQKVIAKKRKLSA